MRSGLEGTQNCSCLLGLGAGGSVEGGMGVGGAPPSMSCVRELEFA